MRRRGVGAPSRVRVALAVVTVALSLASAPRAQGPTGPVSPLYLTGINFGGGGPNTGGIKVVQGGGVIHAWDELAYEGALAVYTSVKALGGVLCSPGPCGPYRAQYTLAGAFVDSVNPGAVPLSSPTQSDYLYDGATDGTLNYAVGTLTRNVYSFNKDWGAFKKLFTLPVPPAGGLWLGITYDRSTDSLWISSHNFSNVVVHYSKTGVLLGSFPLDTLAGYNLATGLALDSADDTLWVVRENTLSGFSVGLQQYAKDGTLLGSMTAPELQTFDTVGAEFRSGPPDLIVTTVTDPPVKASPGSQYAVTDTTLNQGVSSSGVSTARYYLSLDAVRNTGDRLLSGTRAVPALAAGTDSNGPATVTIPTTLPAGTYYQLACADDQLRVKEGDENNNCLASANTIEVALPDLLETGVSNPPESVTPGGKFAILDTVLNSSAVTAAATTTRYFLSVDLAKDAGDVVLGSRSVPVLTAGTSSAGNKSVIVPAGTAVGAYHVLVCADDLGKVGESDEANNCAAAALVATVGYPDLVPSSVGNPPASAMAGQSITASDTVLNQGTATAGPSSTRYYLSLDASWSAGDVLLTGSRSVLGLAAGATSAGSRVVTIPAGTATGSYRLLACADDVKKVGESDEANNCAPSAGSVAVGP